MIRVKVMITVKVMLSAKSFIYANIWPLEMNENHKWGINGFNSTYIFAFNKVT